MPHNNTSASSFHISCSWQSHNDVQRVRSIQSMKTDINQFNIYFYLFILASKKLHGGHTKRTPHRVCRVMPWTGVAFWPLTRITPIIASSLHLLVGKLCQGGSEHFVLKADITAVSTPHRLNSAGQGCVTVWWFGGGSAGKPWVLHPCGSLLHVPPT